MLLLHLKSVCFSHTFSFQLRRYLLHFGAIRIAVRGVKLMRHYRCLLAAAVGEHLLGHQLALNGNRSARQ